MNAVGVPWLFGQAADTDLAAALEVEGVTGWDWLRAAIVFAAAIMISRLAKWLLRRVLRRHADEAVADVMSRLAGYTLVVFGLVYALEEVGIAIGPLLGALGIVGIALAFALRDILENFVAGVMLQLRRPFTYGDEVEINDRAGRVEDIDARLVTIVTPDGETLMVPSAVVIKSEVVNYSTQAGRRTDLDVGVAYGTDLSTAREVLLAAVRDVDGVRPRPEPQVLLTGFGESSIDFVVRYWHAPSIAAFWQTRSDVAFAVEAALADAGITIPFPQRTLWYGADSDD